MHIIPKNGKKTSKIFSRCSILARPERQLALSTVEVPKGYWLALSVAEGMQYEKKSGAYTTLV